MPGDGTLRRPLLSPDTVPSFFLSWFYIRHFEAPERLRLAKRPFVTGILRSMEIEEHPHVIAVVDDDHRVLESLGELLESAGYSVRLFESAEAFLQADANDTVDAVVSDIRMPGVNGIELQDRLAARRPHLPVILITARGDVALDRSRKPNNRGVFAKPVDAAELIKAIRDALKEGN